MEKIAINTLTFAVCPLSNQECEWMKDDLDFRAIHKASKLYMIAQRKEIRFKNVALNDSQKAISFDLECGDEVIPDVKLPVDQFMSDEIDALKVEVGEKMIRIRVDESGKNLDDCKIIMWLTPDRIFTFFSRGWLSVHGLNEYRRFTTFKLHYVGISKAHDSFTRLFENGHESRSRILGNEYQMTPTARLTDELMIFMFEVEALQIQSLGNNDTDVDDSAFDITQLDCSALAADAEKAFVKILNAEYNLEKYSNYPRGIDGLFGIGLARYSFVINECYTFETTTASIKGAKFYDFNVSDQPDLVFIEGERVALVKAT